MNGAQTAIPDTVNPHAADAVAALGSGDKLFTGSGDEGNTFGNATLIAASQALTAKHVMPDQTPGYHVLPTDHSASARALRFRRLTNGTFVGGGVCAGYHQVYVAGYTIPTNGDDMALLDLATPVTHIPPMAVYTGHPVAGLTLMLCGWGLDGAAVGAGAFPQDARTIAGRLAGVVNSNVYNRATSMSNDGVNPGPNLYDSGSPMVALVGGVWKLAGVMVGSGYAACIESHIHDESFQIPGLYTPGEDELPAFNPPTTWLYSNDTVIDQASPALDSHATESIEVRRVSGKGATNTKTVFAGFDCAPIANMTAIGATLRLLLPQGSAGMAGLKFSRIRRAVTHLANWNTYDGVSNWAVAGATDTDLDVFATDSFTVVVPAVAVGGELLITHASLLAMLNAARREDGILRMLLESTAVDTGQMQPYSLDRVIGGERPRLQVQVYKGTGVPDAGSRRRRS